jgi:hexosaminidase
MKNPKRTSRPWAAWAVAAALILGTATAIPAADRTRDLMPAPAKIAPADGKFRVTEAFAVAGEGDPGARARNAAARFMFRLSGRTGLFLKQDFLRNPAPGGAVPLTYAFERPGKLEPAEDESYRLTVTPDRVSLTAKTDLGVLRGLETLLQLLSSDGQGYYFPCVEVEDAPRFTWRGLMIDASRHFMPVDMVKRNLDGMAAVKLNVLHWHLSDDQGFRVECRTWPRLHKFGSDGLYYTQDQIRDVIAYAADRGIRVMPEFDIPGHSTSWLAAYPEYAGSAGPFAIERKFGIFDPTFNPALEKTYAFLDAFIKEMAALFPDPYFHIGGDEVSGVEWNASPVIAAFKKKHGFADNEALHAYFNTRILKSVARYGKKMVGWDEIFQPGLPKDIVIHSWRGREAMIESAKKGYRSLLSNGYYIDLCQPAFEHYLNDPVTEDAPLTEDQKKLILGGEATMWAELITPETVDSRIWPRTAAIAERFWSPQSVKDVEDMYRRMGIISLQLEEHGLRHVSYQAMLLRRLSGKECITALKTLADVTEPLKRYARHEQADYTSLSPFTRFVDACPPESMAARDFRASVDRFLKTKDKALADEIKASLARWRDNGKALAPVIAGSPALAEIGPLSDALTFAGEKGLRALEIVIGGGTTDVPWADEILQTLAEAKKPKAHAELAILPAIEALVKAAVRM